MGVLPYITGSVPSGSAPVRPNFPANEDGVCVGGVVLRTAGVRRAASRASSWRRLWALCSTVWASIFANWGGTPALNPQSPCGVAHRRRTPRGHHRTAWRYKGCPRNPGFFVRQASHLDSTPLKTWVSSGHAMCVVCGGRRKMSRPVPFAHIKLSTFAREG